MRAAQLTKSRMTEARQDMEAHWAQPIAPGDTAGQLQHRDPEQLAATMLGVPIAELARWSVKVGHEMCSLPEFLSANSDPSILQELVASVDAEPFKVGIGGGWSDEIKLLKPA